MHIHRKLTILVLLLLVAVAAVLSVRSTTVRNLYYAWNYELEFDRYGDVDQTTSEVNNAVHDDNRKAGLVSAFFGVDDGLPLLADWVICRGANGKDGMPIIFTSEIDHTTLEPGDLRIIRSSGSLGKIDCLTMAPADDRGELRTALLAGQFGSLADPPLRVEVIGNVLSLDQTVNFKGSEVDVTPLQNGPRLVWAEVVPKDQWTIGAKATGIPFGGGSGCPAVTEQVIRATWSGGVTRPDGTPAGDQERELYQVTVIDSGSRLTNIVPVGLADIGDGDNNHKLCLDRKDRAVSVSFPKGYLTDPRDDLNPETSVAISR